MVFMISYDLNKSGKNYDGVIKAIKESSTGVWCHLLESTWIIKSKLTVDQISDKIKAEADKDDKWIVIEVKDNKQGWFAEEQWAYVNNLIFD